MAYDKHHFVPRGLLALFTIEGESSLIWEYDKENATIHKKEKSIRRICSQQHYYADFDENEELVDKEKREAILQKEEDAALRIIQGLAPNVDGTHIAFTQEEKARLSLFIAIQYFRVPAFRTRFCGMLQKKLIEYRDKFVDEGKLDDLTEMAPPEIREAIDRVGLKKVLNPKVIKNKDLIFIGEGIKELAQLLYSKAWKFCMPPQGMSLAISDNPVQSNDPNPTSPSIFSKDAQTLMPLRKDLAMFCYPSHKLSKESFEEFDGIIDRMDRKRSLSLIKIMIKGSTKYIYHPERDCDIVDLLK